MFRFRLSGAVLRFRLLAAVLPFRVKIGVGLVAASHSMPKMGYWNQTVHSQWPVLQIDHGGNKSSSIGMVAGREPVAENAVEVPGDGLYTRHSTIYTLHPTLFILHSANTPSPSHLSCPPKHLWQTMPRRFQGTECMIALPRHSAGSGIRIQGSGFRVQGPGFRVQGTGLGAQVLDFRRMPHPDTRSCSLLIMLLPRHSATPETHVQENSFSSSLFLSSLELSDTQDYEPYIRALLGTASHFCGYRGEFVDYDSGFQV